MTIPKQKKKRTVAGTRVKKLVPRRTNSTLMKQAQLGMRDAKELENAILNGDTKTATRIFRRMLLKAGFKHPYSKRTKSNIAYTQGVLKVMGYFHGNIDGSRKSLETAVKNYQIRYSLPEDKALGVITFTSMTIKFVKRKNKSIVMVGPTSVDGMLFTAASKVIEDDDALIQIATEEYKVPKTVYKKYLETRKIEFMKRSEAKGLSGKRILFGQ